MALVMQAATVVGDPEIYNGQAQYRRALFMQTGDYARYTGIVSFITGYTFA